MKKGPMGNDNQRKIVLNALLWPTMLSRRQPSNISKRSGVTLLVPV